jgi:hypothetical protein
LLYALFLIGPFTIDTFLPIVFETPPIAIHAVEEASSTSTRIVLRAWLARHPMTVFAVFRRISSAIGFAGSTFAFAIAGHRIARLVNARPIFVVFPQPVRTAYSRSTGGLIAPFLANGAFTRIA